MMTVTDGRRSRFVLVFAALAAVSSSARATAPEQSAQTVCTFSSGAITYDERFAGQTLIFSWNNATGAVQWNGASCTPEAAAAGGSVYWDDLEGGEKHVVCGFASVPGSVTPGFSTSSNNTSSVYLILANGAEIKGTIHAGGSQNQKPVVFSGAYRGAHSYLLTGYGSVTCTSVTTSP